MLEFPWKKLFMVRQCNEIWGMIHGLSVTISPHVERWCHIYILLQHQLHQTSLNLHATLPSSLHDNPANGDINWPIASLEILRKVMITWQGLGWVQCSFYRRWNYWDAGESCLCPTSHMTVELTSRHCLNPWYGGVGHTAHSHWDVVLAVSGSVLAGR